MEASHYPMTTDQGGEYAAQGSPETEEFTFTREQLDKLLHTTIDMYEEHIMRHALGRDTARTNSIAQMLIGLDAEKAVIKLHGGRIYTASQILLENQVGG